MEINTAANDLVDVCIFDVSRGISVNLCDIILNEVWDTQCKDYRDKLNSYSKVENYLQSRGII